MRADTPLSPGAPQRNVYEEAAKNSGFLAPGYLALVTEAHNSGEVEGKKSKFGKSLNFENATPDLNHIVFKSQVPLTQKASGEGLYEWNASSPNTVELVSVLPGTETSAIEPDLGGFRNYRNAISSDGSRIIWTGGEEEQGGILYMTDVVKHETVQISAATEGLSEPDEEQLVEGLGEARFQAASADGSKIFFEDPWPLTKASNLNPVGNIAPVDLYEYDVSTKTLTDITADNNVGEHADVVGTIPGASSNGSTVYFVANGVLAPGASKGNCANVLTQEPHATCNLYVSEHQSGPRTTKLIAKLSGDDFGDWGGASIPWQGRPLSDLAYVSASVSSSGNFLAFMSNRSLTGYDNEDLTSKATGERLDEEVFLYDASAGRIVCASCNPSGRVRSACSRPKKPAKERACSWTARDFGGVTKARLASPNTGWPARSQDGPRSSANPRPGTPSTSRDTCPTPGDCSSTRPTRWSRRITTPRRTSTSTSLRDSKAAGNPRAVSR